MKAGKGGSSRRLAVAVVLAVGGALTPLPVLAHDLGVAKVQLEEISVGRYRLEAKLPPGYPAAAPILPQRCTTLGDPAVRTVRSYSLVTWDVACAGEPLAEGDGIHLPWNREGALVTWHASDSTRTARFFEARADGGIEVDLGLLLQPERSLAGVVRHYVVLGVEHILMGWDHLAFVFALFLIAQGWHLARLVTAFTVGHSLTLAAAVLGWTALPIPPVEACIALSVALLAREAVLIGRGEVDRSHHGVGVVLAFGLLHGLGFASALGDAGVPPSELIAGLLAFNVGVELGQLLFIGVLSPVLAALRSLHVRPGFDVRVPVAQALGVVAMMWTLDRVIGFWP